MKILTAILITAVIMMPIDIFAKDNSSHGQGWRYSVGVGALYAPKYLGDDENQLSAIPNLRIAYEDKFFASLGEGIGYNVISTENWKIGPIVKYDFGRNEDGSNLLGTGDDTNDLLGLGDVEGTVEIGAYIEYSFKPITIKGGVRIGLGGHEGLVGEASVEYSNEVNVYGQRFIYSIGPKIKYTDLNYNEAFFNVNAAQSATSGLGVYDAGDATLSYGFGGRLIVPHTKHISTVIFADYTKLGDEIADSSLVSQRGSDTQNTVGLYINYNF